MGKVDTVTKAYMRKNNIFADAFNYLIYEGKPVVDPEQLRELDTTEIALPFGSQEKENGQSDDLVQKYRDILKSAVVMQEDEVAYILLGIENQTDIHYAMPVRNMIYDALNTESRSQILLRITEKVIRVSENVQVGNIYPDFTKRMY